MKPTVRRRLGAAARALFAIAGVAFMVVAFMSTWDRSEGVPWPGVPAILGATVLTAIALWLALLAWARLLGQRATAPLAAGFYLAQLGKYVPGAVWQAVGQVGYASRDGVGTRRAGVAFVVSALTQVAGSLVFGPLVALTANELPTLLRLAIALGPLAVLVLHRGWMRRLVRWYERRRGEVDGDPVPPQRAILVAGVLASGTQVAVGLAFAALLPTPLAPAQTVLAVAAFPVAWAVGFLALPLPAGLGLREAVLIALLAGVASPTEVVAAAVLSRLAWMAAEGGAVLVSRLVVARSGDAAVDDA